MPFQLKPPVQERYELTKTDKAFGSEGTYIEVRQATQYEHERRNAVFADLRSKFGNDGTMLELITSLNQPELQRIEAGLTLAGANLLDEDDQPLFKFKEDTKGRSRIAMTEREFSTAWGLLPLIVTSEIIEKVHELNPDWGGPEGEGL